MDMRPDATLGGKRVDHRNILRAAFGKAPAIFARAHPADRDALDQRPVDRNLRNPSRRETDDESPAVEGTAERRFVEDVAADGITDPNGPQPAGQFLPRFAQPAF